MREHAQGVGQIGGAAFPSGRRGMHHAPVAGRTGWVDVPEPGLVGRGHAQPGEELPEARGHAGVERPQGLAAFVALPPLLAGAADEVDERLLDLLHAESAIREASTPLPPTPSAQASISFENITFAYPARPQTPALTDICLRIAPGESVALVGPSGAGKSSLLQAGRMPLLRQQGQLPLYCRPAGDPLRALRQEIGALLTGPPATEDLPTLLAQLSAQTERPIVILWDQFEELFTLLGAEIGAQLAREIARCLRQPGLDVRFLLALREDFLAHLDCL